MSGLAGSCVSSCHPTLCTIFSILIQNNLLESLHVHVLASKACPVCGHFSSCSHVGSFALIRSMYVPLTSQRMNMRCISDTSDTLPTSALVQSRYHAVHIYCFHSTPSLAVLYTSKCHVPHVGFSMLCVHAPSVFHKKVTSGPSFSAHFHPNYSVGNCILV